MIVPKQTDALNALVEASQRVSALERGCSDGPTTEPTPSPDTPDEPNSGGDTGAVDGAGDVVPPDGGKGDVSLEIIPRGISTVRKSGKLAYPHGGLYPLYGQKKKNYLRGLGVDSETNRADRVTIQARVKTRAIRHVETGAWSVLFHLPPGWWPTTEVTAKAKTALGGLGSSPDVTVRVTTQGHVEARGPFHHPVTGSGGPGPAIQALDLRGITFPAGGGAWPGFPANDPTAAGDGSAWDFCDGDGGPGDPDPIVDTNDTSSSPAGTVRYGLAANTHVDQFAYLPWVPQPIFPGAPGNDAGVVDAVDIGGGIGFKTLTDGVYEIQVYLRSSPDTANYIPVAAISIARPGPAFVASDSDSFHPLALNSYDGIPGGTANLTVRLPAGAWIVPAHAYCPAVVVGGPGGVRPSFCSISRVG